MYIYIHVLYVCMLCCFTSIVYIVAKAKIEAYTINHYIFGGTWRFYMCLLCRVLLHFKYIYIYICLFICIFTWSIHIYLYTIHYIYKYTHVILIFIETIAYSSLRQVVSEIIWPETAGKGIGPKPLWFHGDHGPVEMVDICWYVDIAKMVIFQFANCKRLPAGSRALSCSSYNHIIN